MTNQHTIDDVKKMPLKEVIALSKIERLSRQVVDEYIAAWNDGPHFTKLKLSLDGHSIVQFLPSE